MFCSLHNSKSKEQHEQYLCNPSSHNRKNGESRGPSLLEMLSMVGGNVEIYVEMLKEIKKFISEM